MKLQGEDLREQKLADPWGLVSPFGWLGGGVSEGLEPS